MGKLWGGGGYYLRKGFCALHQNILGELIVVILAFRKRHLKITYPCQTLRSIRFRPLYMSITLESNPADLLPVEIDGAKYDYITSIFVS